VPPKNAQMEMTESTPSSPIEVEKIDATPESETEDEAPIGKSDQPILPVEEELCDSSESSPAFSDSRILSDLPSEGGTSDTSYPARAPTQNLEEVNPPMVNNGQDNPVYEETAANYERTSQASIAEGEDTTQTQATINKKNAQIWNELGNIYYNTGAFDEAMHAFEMAIELDPIYGWSYNNLASIYIHNKRYAEAIPLYEKGLQLLDEQKDKAVLWNRMGDAYRRLNEQEQAVMAYRKAMELDPDNVSLLTRARFSLLGNLRV
jgi:tetratricopeptide (TPR) repeat protein